MTAWLRAVLWGAFVIPLSAFLIAAWWGLERAESDAERTVEKTRDIVYRHAMRSFEVAADVGARADLAASDVDGAEADVKRLHQRLMDMAVGLTSVVNINVWDAQGHSVARSDAEQVDRKVSVADRAYFIEQRDTPRPLGVSEVLTGRQTGVELLNATLRRRSSDGSFKGVIAVSLSPDHFRDYYRSLASEDPKLATFALIRTDGEILARWPRTPDGRSKVAPDSPVLSRVRAGEDAGNGVLPATPGRETRLVSFRRVGTYPLYVAVGFSRNAMLAGWVRFVGLLAAVLVPVTAGLVYVSWVALKKTRLEQATAIELREQLRLRAAAERSLVESQKLETLAVVTAGVAHDFNNLLAALSASLHVHKRQHPDLASEKQVQSMSRAVLSGVRLTRQLLSFSRRQALRPETVRLQDWLPATEGLIRSTLGSKVVWEASVAADTAPVHADVGELELALINLVVNARHAMAYGGTLSINAANTAHAPGTGRGMVQIAVTDSGTGIPAELLNKVFEPFFTTRDKGVGSGLGLSQVQGFCVQAGGSVAIESRVGQGTTVRMLLPASGDPVAVDTPSKEQPAETLSGHVLLVEDNDEVGSTTALLLRTAGLGVTRASSGDAALSAIESAAVEPDIVLSDIAMPGKIDGIALALELRRIRPRLPVLLTTGYAEQVGVAVAAGVRVLPKPVPPDELLAEMRLALAAA